MSRFRLLLVIMSVISLLTATSCWDRKEIDTLAIVAALGIDVSETPGEFLISAQLIRPGQMANTGDGSAGSGQGKPSWVIRSSAETMFRAVRELTAMSSRRLYFPHNQVVVFGEEAARQGIAPLLDFLTRDDELRPTVWVMVAKGKASDILEGMSGFASVPGLALSQLIQTRFASSEIAGLQVDHLHARMLSKTFAPVATSVSLTSSNQEQLGDSPESAPLNPEEQEEQVIRLDGTAILKGDKLVGRLDLLATRGYLWVQDEVETGVLVMDGPGVSGKISLEILTASTKVKPRLQGDSVKVQVDVRAACNLAEQYGAGKLATPELFQELEQLAAETIKYEITLALNEAQRLNADIFGFGEAVHKSHPRQWAELEQQWEQIFPNVDVELKVEVTLRRFGQIVEMPIPQSKR